MELANRIVFTMMQRIFPHRAQTQTAQHFGCGISAKLTDKHSQLASLIARDMTISKRARFVNGRGADINIGQSHMRGYNVQVSGQCEGDICYQLSVLVFYLICPPFSICPRRPGRERSQHRDHTSAGGGAVWT